MTSKILEEVRQISSQKIAEKQKAAENKYPSLIEKIKQAAGTGKTECVLIEHEVDEYSKRLLEQDGFTVYVTTEKADDYKSFFASGQREFRRIWIIRW